MVNIQAVRKRLGQVDWVWRLVSIMLFLIAFAAGAVMTRPTSLPFGLRSAPGASLVVICDGRVEVTPVSGKAPYVKLDCPSKDMVVVERKPAALNSGLSTLASPKRKNSSIAASE